MAYRVKAKEFVLEADSSEEFKSILAMLGIIHENKPTTRATTILGKLEVATAPPFSLNEKLQKLYTRLLINPDSAMLRTLKTLAANPDGLSDAKLRELLGFKGAGLGGTMGGLSKRAIATGLTIQDIILKEDKDGSSHYRLTDAIREFIESKEIVRRAYPPLIPQQKEGAEDM